MNLIFVGIPGGPELILIAFIVLLLFGGKKLPELMRGLGKGIREFNSAKSTIKSELEDAAKIEDENSNASATTNTGN